MKKINFKKTLDIRIHKNGRWIDQKCTPDVLFIISRLILQTGMNSFNSKDLLNQADKNKIVEDFFKKPSVKDKAASNEYDKFFHQPCKMLSQAGILLENKKGNQITFTILDLETLKFLAEDVNNCITFLSQYTEGTLEKSGLSGELWEFLKKQTPESHETLKNAYVKCMQKNTNIKKELEPRRQFAKIINPITFEKNLKGTSKGRLSKDQTQVLDLFYNKKNFRDKQKLKKIPRNKHKILIKEFNDHIENQMPNYKAKQIVKDVNKESNAGLSIVNKYYPKMALDQESPATHAHHIFPESRFTKLAFVIENLIPLTPSEHNIKAHPNNKTSLIDLEYQKTLLKVQYMIIINNQSIYNLNKFIEVLNIGYETTIFNETDTKDEIFKKIENM